jgi:hypothetical protein
MRTLPTPSAFRTALLRSGQRLRPTVPVFHRIYEALSRFVRSAPTFPMGCVRLRLSARYVASGTRTYSMVSSYPSDLYRTTCCSVM